MVSIALLIFSAAWIIATPRWVADSSVTMPAAPRQGFLAPAFSLETLNGGEVQLSQFQGQPVILNFWASWCPPCRAEMPDLQDVHLSYRQHGLNVITVNATYLDSISDAARFLEQVGVSLPTALDIDGSVSRRYQVRALPSTFFVDSDGVIRKVVIGGPLSPAMLKAEAIDLLGVIE